MRWCWGEVSAPSPLEWAELLEVWRQTAAFAVENGFLYLAMGKKWVTSLGIPQRERLSEENDGMLVFERDPNFPSEADAGYKSSFALLDVDTVCVSVISSLSEMIQRDSTSLATVRDKQKAYYDGRNKVDYDKYIVG